MMRNIIFEYSRMSDNKKYNIKFSRENFENNTKFQGELCVELADNCTEMIIDANDKLNYKNIDLQMLILNTAADSIEIGDISRFNSTRSLSIEINIDDLINAEDFIDKGYKIVDKLKIVWNNHDIIIEEQ